MSLTGDNTAKFWASCPKVLGHRRRSSSSGLFNINITEPILSKYKHLAKLHSESSIGFNAINRPSLPRGTLFRSSLPATPLTSPMYTSIVHQFTEKAIQDLLSKSSTPKVVKSSSNNELKLDNLQLSSAELRENLSNISTVNQNIITRGSLMNRPKTLDIKSKMKLDPLITKMNENSKSDEEINNQSSTCLYYSIKEEQEEIDNDCATDEMKKLGEQTNKPNESCNSVNKDVTKILNNFDQNSAIETILLNDSCAIDKTVQSFNNISMDDKRIFQVSENNSDKKKTINQNNTIHNSSEIITRNTEPQMNCLFVKNLHHKLNNDELKDYFCKFGNVIQAKIIFNHLKQSKCFGFVTFNNQNDVQKILSLPKETFKLKGRLVQLSLARNKTR